MKKMYIELERIEKDCSCIGELWVDGVKRFYTLEPKNPIPKGEYNITLYDSPIHGYLVPLLNGVPGYAYIEIHIGNSIKDTQGCILIGMSKNTNIILESTKAFLIFMLKYPNINPCSSLFLNLFTAKLKYWDH